MYILYLNLTDWY